MISAESTMGSFVLCGIGAVSANAADGDVNGIDVGVGIASVTPTWPVSQVRVVVQSEREIRLRETVVEAVFQQRARAAADFFGRLADEQDRAVPWSFSSQQRARCRRRASCACRGRRRA